MGLFAEQVHVLLRHLGGLEGQQQIGLGHVRAGVALAGGDPVHDVGALVVDDDVSGDEVAVAQLDMLGHAVQPGQQLVFDGIADGVQAVDEPGQLILQLAQLGHFLLMHLQLEIHHILQIPVGVLRMLLHQILQGVSLDEIHGDGPVPVDDRYFVNGGNQQVGILDAGMGQRFIQSVGLPPGFEDLNRFVSLPVDVDGFARGNQIFQFHVVRLLSVCSLGN